MPDAPTSLFSRDGRTLIPTELVRGPWNHDQQHGGAVSGALGFAVTEECRRAEDADSFILTRLTVEILKPVPAQPLSYRAETVRHGRRSRVIAAELLAGDTPVARASSQWAIHQTHDAAGSVLPPMDTRPDPAVPRRPTEPSDPGAADVGYPRPGFNCDVFELRCLRGSTEEPGPGTVWVRMLTDLVDGVEDHPVFPLATLADLGNAVGWDWSPHGRPMINPDVTLQLFRYPVDEWVCLQSVARATGAGVGIMETRLWDGDGQFGLAISTSMESAVPLTIELPGR
ncbi:MAG: thioesterase family protein [Actinomycetota bacterium]